MQDRRTSDTGLKICFLITPIGERNSDTFKRSDLVLRHVLRPVAESCGYKAIRADEISAPGSITKQMLQYLRTAPLAIADLTERNPNVYYELAIRHVFRMPTVQVLRRGESLPFDIRDIRTVDLDIHDPDSVEAARSGLTKQVELIQEDPTEHIVTPVTDALGRDSDWRIPGKTPVAAPAASGLPRHDQGMQTKLLEELRDVTRACIDHLNRGELEAAKIRLLWIDSLVGHIEG